MPGTDAPVTAGILIGRRLERVRVGWFTRTEVIPLSDGFYLIGPSQGHCPG